MKRGKWYPITVLTSPIFRVRSAMFLPWPFKHTMLVLVRREEPDVTFARKADE